MKKRISLLLLSALLVFAVPTFAQDTPSPEAPTQTADVVTATPSAEITPEATVIVVVPPVTPEPEKQPFDITPFVPFIVGVLGLVAIAVLTLLGVQSVLLFRSQPIAWAVAKPLIQTGADKLAEYTKSTEALWDDAIAAEFAKRWAEFESKVDAKVENKVGTEVQKQLPDAVSQAIG